MSQKDFDYALLNEKNEVIMEFLEHLLLDRGLDGKELTENEKEFLELQRVKREAIAYTFQYFKIKPTAFLIWSAIHYFQEINTGESPSIAWIAKYCSISDAQVTRTLRILEEKKMITVNRNWGTSHKYVLPTELELVELVNKNLKERRAKIESERS